MNKIKCITAVLAVALIGANIGTNEALAQNRLGINVGYNVDAEEIFAGGQFRVGLPGFPITVNPSLETYFIEDVTRLQIDVNALYLFGVNNVAFTPYAGAGLGVNYIKPENLDSETDAGLNLIAGANFGFGRLSPFAEARINVAGSTNVGLRGGLLIGL